ncbi:MAG: hypothetical protein C0392_15875 [Syntrophus sp. (in: bacteria)]|nr:hypothetical protein [Syntrophus sp. (in: bacteria)]
MVDYRNDHKLIAQILSSKVVSSAIFNNFYDSIDTLLILNQNPPVKLEKVKPSYSNKKVRQCLTKQRWNFHHPKMRYKRDGVAAFVQLEDNETGEDNIIIWGISWWGSEENSTYIRNLFIQIKGLGKLDDRITKIGATGRFLRVILKKYGATDVLSRKSDIKKEIAEDINGIINRINNYLA